jgi:stress response protein YsnF
MTDPDHLAATPAFARARDDADDHHAMTISEEVLHVSTEWAEAGRVRLRRRIVTEARTVQVTLRREELQIEVEDVDEKRDVLTGSRRDGLATSRRRGASR